MAATEPMDKALNVQALKLVTSLAAGATAAAFREGVTQLGPADKQRLQVPRL